MDIIEECKSVIDEELSKIDAEVQDQVGSLGNESQTQRALIDANIILNKDKNMDRITEQQTYLKMLIDRDIRIQAAKTAIREHTAAIEILRKECAKIAIDGAKEKQRLQEDQAKDIERFQIQQMRSIQDDFQRHQKILETRRREIVSLKKETEIEEEKRPAALAEVEKNLEKQISTRQLSTQK